jgi:hypothetical protein
MRAVVLSRILLSRGGGPPGDATCYLARGEGKFRFAISESVLCGLLIPVFRASRSFVSPSPCMGGGRCQVRLVQIRGRAKRVIRASDQSAGGDARGVVEPPP